MQSVLQMNVYGVDGCGPFTYLLLLPTKSIEFVPAAGLTVVWLLLRLSDAMPSHHRRRSDDDDDGFFLACEDFLGRSFSFPVCAYFFFKVEISSRTPIPLFRPGSVHSGSAS